MDVSLFLAKVFSLYLCIFGLAMLGNHDRFVKDIDHILENRAVMFLSAITVLILGILLVISHNVWVAGWPVIVTILSWMTFTKGALMLLMPSFEIKRRHLLKQSSVFYSIAIIYLVIGVYLGYVGFFQV
ncbi:MAG: hypothetical protein ACE365_02055 [Gammaproteobacteria bacterium]